MSDVFFSLKGRCGWLDSFCSRYNENKTQKLEKGLKTSYLLRNVFKHPYRPLEPNKTSMISK